MNIQQSILKLVFKSISNKLLKMISRQSLFAAPSVTFVLCLTITNAAIHRGSSSISRRTTCYHEIGSANKTMFDWGVAMRQIIAGSPLPATNDNSMGKEAKKIQDLIENFGANLNRKPIEQSVKDLVTIRRRSNRMALDIYLKTLDMRWPQTSVRLGVAVERVQQACLSNPDRAAMMVLNPSYSKSHKDFAAR